MEATLLVEILTEELPPKSLSRLSIAFRDGLLAALKKDGFVPGSAEGEAFATPRRLAVRVSGVLAKSPDSAREVQGPSVGAPAKAIAGFAKKNGVPAESLEQRDTAKGKVFIARVATDGK